MRILITGAHGFIGRHLAKSLSLTGHEITGIGHGAWPDGDRSAWYKGTWLNGDITFANLDILASSVGVPEAIIHLAGGSCVGLSIAAPAEDFHRSVVTTGDLIEWVRLCAPDARVVMASSAAVYGANHSSNISESAVCVPFSPYGYHKRMAELILESYALNFGIKVGVVRLFSVYGPELRKQLLWDICKQLASGVSELILGGDGSELRDWLHVEDATQVLLLALKNASDDFFIVNGGTGNATSVRQITEGLCKYWGGKVQVKFTGLSRPGDPRFLVSDIERLQSLDAVPKILWNDGLEEYVNWYKSQIEKVPT